MADIPALATNRPIHTAMTPRRLCEEFGIGMSDWRTAIDRRVGELMEEIAVLPPD